jgi:hypothetical protein
VKLSKGKVAEAVHKGLKSWDIPTRDGMELFAQLKVARKFGYTPNLSIVEGRIAISNMLFAYIIQLERLQPVLAQVLIRRYKYKDSTKKVAYSMNVSADQINRMQREGINYISEFIYDDETRRTRKEKGN